MVCAQLFAFGRVSQRREEGRERRERKREERRLALLKREKEELDSETNGFHEVGNGSLNGSTTHAKQHKRIPSLKKHFSEEETEDEIIM